MKPFLDYLNHLYVTDFIALIMFMMAAAGFMFMFGWYCVKHWVQLLKERLKMRKRGKLKKAVQEIFEEIVVDGLTDCVNRKEMTDDEARILYAKLAHTGLWGLHPRKFAREASPEDQHELKERLREKHPKGADPLDGLLAELQTKFA